jgi:hypothetical protein
VLITPCNSTIVVSALGAENSNARIVAPSRATKCLVPSPSSELDIDPIGMGSPAKTATVIQATRSITAMVTKRRRIRADMNVSYSLADEELGRRGPRGLVIRTRQERITDVRCDFSGLLRESHWQVRLISGRGYGSAA